MTAGSQVPGSGHCGEDVAAYALGALEPAEAAAFARHLETCAVCRDELESFQQIVGLLPTTAPAFKASPKLRRRVRRAIAAEPHPDAIGDASTTPSARIRVPRWLPRPVLGVAGGLAVIAIVLVIVFTSGGSSSRVVNAQVTGRGTATVKISGDRAQLVVHDLTPPPKGKIYELWLVHGHQPPQPASALLRLSASGDTDVNVPGSVRGDSQLMVTPEPAGGSTVPTHAPVIAATLS